MSEPPVCSTFEEKDRAFHEADEKDLPTLLVSTVGRRKYASVECDFVSAGGWTLDEDGKEEATDLFEEYRAKVSEDPEHKQGGVTYGAGLFSTFSPLREPLAVELGEELTEIVMDRSNWTER